MQLYASLTSPYARKIRVVLAEKKLPFELVEDSPWEALTRVPQFNPLGKVPVLITDGGEIWFDSPIIASYLELLAPHPALLPAEPLAALAVRQFEALADGILDAAVAIVMDSRRPPERQDAEGSTRQMTKITRSLDVLEERLDGKIRFGGDAINLADVAVGCALLYLDFRLPDYDWRDHHPALTALVEELSERPSFAATHPPA